MTTITLTHYAIGPLRVHIWEDATWWKRRRTWTCDDDPELGSFEDGDFEEAPATIDRLLLAARDEFFANQRGHFGQADRFPSLA